MLKSDLLKSVSFKARKLRFKNSQSFLFLHILPRSRSSFYIMYFVGWKYKSQQVLTVILRIFFL